MDTRISKCNFNTYILGVKILLLYYSTSCSQPAQKATIHQVTTMLATSKNVLFPGHNHQCWWPFTLIITLAGSQASMVDSGFLPSDWLFTKEFIFRQSCSLTVSITIAFVVCNKSSSMYQLGVTSKLHQCKCSHHIISVDSVCKGWTIYVCIVYWMAPGLSQDICCHV